MGDVTDFIQALNLRDCEPAQPPVDEDDHDELRIRLLEDHLASEAAAAKVMSHGEAAKSLEGLIMYFLAQTWPDGDATGYTPQAITKVLYFLKNNLIDEVRRREQEARLVQPSVSSYFKLNNTE